MVFGKIKSCIPWNGPRRIVAIVGAGGIENAWKPVHDALERQGFKTFGDADLANLVMATLVYRAREEARSGRIDPHKRPLPPGSDQERLHRVCDEIELHIRRAQVEKKLALRSDVSTAFARFAYGHEVDLAVFTTNWDTELDGLSASAPSGFGRVLHLHGSVGVLKDVRMRRPPPQLARSLRESAGLRGYGEDKVVYLPTEVVTEPYRLPAQKHALQSVHTAFAAALREAERILIYGLALSPLDAELVSALSSALGPSLQDVVIVDLSPAAVAQRLLAVAPNVSRAQIIEVTPHELR